MYCRAAMLGLALAMATGQANAAAEPVRIAVLVGLSGTNAVYGQEQLHAFNAAAELLNARGGVLGGRKLEIVPMDHKNNPQEALIQFKRTTDENIHYVASTVSSIVHALNDAVMKHNARNPEQAVLLLNFNALDPALTEARCSNKTDADLAYLPALCTVEMVAAAMDQVGSADPMKVAWALEGMHFAGPTGDSWLRAEDHQMIGPMLVMSFVKAGTPGARHDVEGTGYGWKTEAVMDAQRMIPPLRCDMQRPVVQ